MWIAGTHICGAGARTCRVTCVGAGQVTLGAGWAQDKKFFMWVAEC